MLLRPITGEHFYRRGTLAYYGKSVDMQSESALIPEYPVFPVSTTGAVRSIINSERGRLYIYIYINFLIA